MSAPGHLGRLNGPWLLAVLVALLPLAVKTAHDAGPLLADPAGRYADTNVPMLTGHDGYAFLRAAESGPAPAAGCTPGDKPPVPALSLLTASVAGLAATTPQWAAFWLPPLLAGLLPLAVFAWGRRFYADPPALAAALAAGSCPYFLDVTAPGRLDTDGLIPSLLLAAALAAHTAATAPKKPDRLRALVGCVLAAGLSWWWWKPGGYLALALLALVPVAAVQGADRKRLVRALSGLAAALAALWAGMAVLALPLPSPVAYALGHAALAFGLSPDTASVARSIIELQPLTPAELGRRCLGHPAVLALACLGIVRLWQRNWPAALILSPLLLAGAAALRSGRLVLLFFPLAALGLGAAIDWLLARLPENFPPGQPARGGLALAAAGLLLLPALAAGLATPDTQPFVRADDRLALAVRAQTPPATVIVSWWDDGYFLRYRADRPVFFDGGSQTTEDCFAAAWGLAADNAEAAANWLLFVAANGPGEIGRLAPRFGSRQATTDWLIQLFSSPPEARTALLATLPGPALDDPAGYFFPSAPACLFLRLDLLGKSGFWLAFAAGPEARVPPNPPNHADIVARQGLVVDAAAGRLQLPDAALAKGYRFVPTVWDVDALPPLPAQLADRADPILFYGQHLPMAVIADQTAARSLALRLLLAPDSAPHRFKKIVYDPAVGGAWMIRPGQEE